MGVARKRAATPALDFFVCMQTTSLSKQPLGAFSSLVVLIDEKGSGAFEKGSQRLREWDRARNIDDPMSNEDERFMIRRTTTCPSRKRRGTWGIRVRACVPGRSRGQRYQLLD